MRRLIIIILIFTGPFSLKSQSWDWLNQEGDNGYDWGYEIITDDTGNVYVTGIFEGPQFFGSVFLNSYGNFDLFIAKYDPAGNLIWVRSAGSAVSDYPSDICLDDNNDIYICGPHAETLDFGTDTLPGSGNNSDIYIAKFTNSGNLIWLRNIGGTGTDGVYAMKKFQSKFYIAGSFSNTVNFDTLPKTSNGGSDGFVGEIDSNGSFLWVETGGGLADDAMIDLTVDGNGYISVIGNFKDSATFSNSTINACGNLGMDAFIIQYDSFRYVRWIQKCGGSFSDYGSTITSDSSGNVYIVGYCAAYPNFPAFFADDSIQLFTSCTYLYKVDVDGDFVWLKEFGGNHWIPDCIAITVDAAQNIYTLCNVRDSAFLDGDTIYSGYPYSTGMFIAKLNPQGSPLGYYQTTSNSYSTILPGDFSMDPYGNIAITGMCAGVTSFGPLSTTNNNSNNIFIAYISSGISIEVQEASENSILVYPNPTSSFINVELADSDGGKIHIFDSKGCLVLQSECKEIKTQLDVRHLPNGIYVLQVFTNGVIQQNARIVIDQ